jgi:hypothetical protein
VSPPVTVLISPFEFKFKKHHHLSKRRLGRLD